MSDYEDNIYVDEEFEDELEFDEGEGEDEDEDIYDLYK